MIFNQRDEREISDLVRRKERTPHLNLDKTVISSDVVVKETLSYSDVKCGEYHDRNQHHQEI